MWNHACKAFRFWEPGKTDSDRTQLHAAAITRISILEECIDTWLGINGIEDMLDPTGIFGMLEGKFSMLSIFNIILNMLGMLDIFEMVGTFDKFGELAALHI